VGYGWMDLSSVILAGRQVRIRQRNLFQFKSLFERDGNSRGFFHFCYQLVDPTKPQGNPNKDLKTAIEKGGNNAWFTGCAHWSP
jgi:hypothetical protein